VKVDNFEISMFNRKFVFVNLEKKEYVVLDDKSTGSALSGAALWLLMATRDGDASETTPLSHPLIGSWIGSNIGIIGELDDNGEFDQMRVNFSPQKVFTAPEKELNPRELAIRSRYVDLTDEVNNIDFIHRVSKTDEFEALRKRLKLPLVLQEPQGRDDIKRILGLSNNDIIKFNLFYEGDEATAYSALASALFLRTPNVMRQIKDIDESKGKITLAEISKVCRMEPTGGMADTVSISCKVCNKEAKHTCTGCNKAHYCSPKCARCDWKNGHCNKCT